MFNRNIISSCPSHHPFCILITPSLLFDPAILIHPFFHPPIHPHSSLCTLVWLRKWRREWWMLLTRLLFSSANGIISFKRELFFSHTMLINCLMNSLSLVSLLSIMLASAFVHGVGLVGVVFVGVDGVLGVVEGRSDGIFKLLLLSSSDCCSCWASSLREVMVVES